ncbi:hypothetical protein [Actinoplanes lobatus]|uniref:Uncharacterized protein n=1 Tax=Actinoplanes lobatus TaxID=113568 RepID=A0A7W7MJZ6_9ACTN|nr:hypothetical protein [Actinoplanes lobatus]MBB4752550.1 hypothetical protein [Actinoplanes lobatus]
MVSVDQQRRQDTSLPSMAEVDDVVVDGCFDVAQQAELYRHSTSAPCSSQLSVSMPPQP